MLPQGIEQCSTMIELFKSRGARGGVTISALFSILSMAGYVSIEVTPRFVNTPGLPSIIETLGTIASGAFLSGFFGYALFSHHDSFIEQLHKTNPLLYPALAFTTPLIGELFLGKLPNPYTYLFLLSTIYVGFLEVVAIGMAAAAIIHLGPQISRCCRGWCTLFNRTDDNDRTENPTSNPLRQENDAAQIYL